MIDERFSKESGILPSRLFFLKLNTCSFDNDPSPAGRLPVRLFPSKLSFRRFEQWEMLAGISPLNELFPRSSACSRTKRPNSWGIVLVKPLFSKLSRLRKLKFPMEGDRLPTSWLEWRSSSMTLRFCLPHVTPDHWQKCKDSFHELSFVGGCEIWALKDSRESLSISLPPLANEKEKECWIIWKERNHNMNELMLGSFSFNGVLQI